MRLVENAQIQSAFVPVDCSSAANNGDWVSLKNYNHITIIFFADTGTAGDDPVFTVRQAQDVAGTGAKALNFTTVHIKNGTQTGIGTFTKVTQSAANTYTNTDAGETENLFVVEFDAEDLDVNNGFDCVQLQIPDTGNNAGKLGCGIYILTEPRYAQATPPSAIVD